MAANRALPDGFGELEVLAVGTVLLIEAISGLSLNGLTIFSFCKTPDLRTPINLLVLSLALADTGISLNALVSAVSSLLRFMISIAFHRRWPYGSEGCQAHGFQGFATALASICGTAALAWGRYHHYCTRRQLTWDTAIPLALFVWLSSAFWASLPLLGWGHYDYEPLGTCCTLDYSRGDRNFISFFFIMAFFNFLVPLFITIISYQLMEQKFSRSGHLQVNTTLPGRMLLLGWGPYALLYLYATIADVNFISPKLQMVPALIAKTMPTINVINYALHSELVCRGIWQCLSPQKGKQDRTQ
ncbi:RPE-retinal G protein-coupled receptor isoform X1 [Meriones unguiculatus]|uniref:RPE-retinal G protein-coupled receptor isoform X1 n=1 Tax=Meriones unguiculatus TaxID=10047 RepID=UPI000B4F2969|nr:RPE-retinal G protein-coupled receptor isoform X1 [Meriones unguiculatus]